MYQAKEARTGFQAYDPSRDRHSRERLTLIAELRRALERDELILHYQPKVDLHDRAASPASRRSCAGSTRSTACAARARSSRTPSTPR